MIVSMQLDKQALREILGEIEDLARVPVPVIRSRFAAWAPRIVAEQRARCPVDEKDGGQLRDSIRFAVTARAERVQLTFLAGGESLRPYLGSRGYIAYPTIQEIDVTLKHRVGQAGFMSRPVAAAYPKILADIVAAVSRSAAG